MPEVLMKSNNAVEDLTRNEYKYGFITDIESDTVPPGLNEDIIRLISTKKNEPEFMLQWRLKAYRHWAKLEKAQAEPKWANIHYPPIDYEAVSYYSAPKNKGEGPKSLEEVDPELLRTYEKLGIPLREQEKLAALQWMRCSIVFRWPPLSKAILPRWELSFVPFPKLCRITLN